MADIYQRLGERLRHYRLGYGWTQEELAEKANFHPAYIGQIERCKKKVSLAAVERLAHALGIEPGALLGTSSPPADSRWQSRISGLLRDKKPSEQAILYNTLRHLAQNIRKFTGSSQRSRKPAR